jgi:hypothetical protein
MPCTDLARVVQSLSDMKTLIDGNRVVLSGVQSVKALRAKVKAFESLLDVKAGLEVIGGGFLVNGDPLYIRSERSARIDTDRLIVRLNADTEVEIPRHAIPALRIWIVRADSMSIFPVEHVTSEPEAKASP